MKETFRNFALGSFIFAVIGLSITFIAYPLIAKITNDHFFGLFIMFIFSTTVRYTMVLLYDFLKTDYLLIEMFKSKKEHKENNLTRRIKKIKKMFGNFILFIFLILTDPFLFAIYYRPDHNKWNGLENVGILFLLSNFLCVGVAGNIMSLIVSIF
jgi:hypothetical protein